ncbi:MAG: hypothetical protein RLO48_15175 [Bauldia litoralis]
MPHLNGLIRLCGAGLMAVALLGAPLALAADATLMGRTVTLRVLTYDDPNAPLFEGRSYATQVGDGTEFGLKTEGVQNDIDVVPIRVDIGPSRIEFSYETAVPGELATAKFNGYVLDFGGDCNLFWSARVDRDYSDFPVTEKRVFFEKGTLYVDVSGLTYDRQSRFAIDLELSGCGST